MAYPDQFLRGIPNEKSLDPDDYPSSELFYFHDRTNQQVREDGNLEESIFWRDDESAEKVILAQQKDGRIQFGGGAALVSRIKLDSLIETPVVNFQLSYERAEIPGNAYHGNLLLRRGLDPRIRKKIAASIATSCVISVIKNPNSQQVG